MIKTEKKYIWLMGYCFIIASIIEVLTYRFLINAGIVAGNETTKDPIIHYGFTLLLASFVCLLFVRSYNQSTEKQRKGVMVISAMGVSIIVIFCIFNLGRLLSCMY